jgi:radical SAM protein with 4Fe4S-binding SPASM domain
VLSARTPVRLGLILADYKRRAEVVRALPIRLWVESSSRCNLRCPMCPNKDLCSDEKGLMDFALFTKIVDEARHFINDMYLHHRGEPLLNPAFFDMITYAREAGIQTRFHSNGTVLDQAKAEKLLQARPDLASFSVDGFEKDAYERIRVGARFETTVANIIRLVEMRKARKQRKPYVVVEKIHFRSPEAPEDTAKVRELWDRFLEAGVDEVIEKEEYTWATEGAPEISDPGARSVCTFPWYAMVICADGAVTPCPQDFFARMNMGNVRDAALREIWNGPAYQDLRRRFKTDINLLPLCRKCDRLRRKTVGGVPFQYMITFLVDQLVGYNRLRRLLGTAERN